MSVDYERMCIVTRKRTTLKESIVVRMKRLVCASLALSGIQRAHSQQHCENKMPETTRSERKPMTSNKIGRLIT